LGIADLADTFDHILHQQVLDGLAKACFRTGLGDGADLGKKVLGVVERKNGLECAMGKWPLAIDPCRSLTQRLRAIEILCWLHRISVPKNASPMALSDYLLHHLYFGQMAIKLLSFIRIKALFLRKRATLPGAFSGWVFSHNVA